MERMWYEGTDLITMNRMLEEIVHQNMKPGRKLGEVVELTYEDFEILGKKLMSISRVEDAERFALSIVVTYVSSFRFEKQGECWASLLEVAKKLPQHQTKFVMESFMTVLYEYQIDNFGYIIRRLSDLKCVVQKHANC